MPRFGQLLFAASLLFSGIALQASSLNWTTKEIDLHAKLGQDSADVSYHFKNTGVADVTILEVHTSCGCTTASLAQGKGVKPECL